MKISVGILSYTIDNNLRRLTARALESYKDADELFVVENGTMETWDTDPFIHIKKNIGFTGGANMILRAAKYDYVAVASNDTYLLEGNLRDLCIPDTVTSPLVKSQPHIRGFAGSFFVIPKTVIAKVGYLNERLQTYYSDTEYLERIQDAGIPMQTVDSVVIWHDIAKTVDTTGENSFRQSNRDRDEYLRIKGRL